MKQMQDDFFGPEIPLDGVNNARFGELAIILQNGRPTRIITPGKKFRRGFRAPLTGNLSFIQVNTESVSYRFTEDAATDDDYWISITVRIDVCLDSDEDYASLWKFLKKNQGDLSKALNGEIHRALERLIRETLGAYSHATLRKQSLSNILHRVETFGEGILKMTSLLVESVLWDENALEMDSVDKKTDVAVAQTHAKARIAGEEILIESLLLEQRIEKFTRLALKTGLPAYKLLPELFPEVQESRERAFELVCQLMQPDMFLKASRHPELIATLVSTAGLTGEQAQLALRGALPQTEGNLPLGSDVTSQQGPDISTPSTMPIDLVTTPSVINYYPPDRRVRHVWDRHQLGELRSASVGLSAKAIFILVVMDPPVRIIHDIDILDDFSTTIVNNKNEPPKNVKIVTLSSALQTVKEVVQAWLDEVTSPSTNIRVQEVIEAGPDATILLTGEGSNEGSVIQEVQRLESIESPEMDSLERLMPYRRIGLQVVA
ncbi:SPFH domain-containing protein [Kocuria rosea]|uniref:SPFH domain-containing protein n=1 Tax=Kocuria rosea TaxID=1275 RepID=UPI0025B7509F|nr:SPFH domain-containing protein [Kocuria rosea]WJZ68346.1 hypothetical protein QR564_18005 [Kocuria rosea]